MVWVPSATALEGLAECGKGKRGDFLQNEGEAQELHTFFFFFLFFFSFFEGLERKLTGEAKSEAGAGAEPHSPHDRAAVASFVGARVAAAWGGRCVAGVDVNGTQLIPAQHGQKVLLPGGGWAVARLV